MNWLLVFLIISLLIFLNALYVAAEFATASSRRPRVAQLAAEGNRLAHLLLRIIDKPANLDTYIAACQLGITASSLVLGFYGQAALATALTPVIVGLGGNPIAAQSLSITLVLLVLTVTQVLLGELVPKNIGIRYPERLAMLTILPLRWSMALFRPLIWLFNGSAQVLLRLFGFGVVAEHAHVHHPDEIRMLIQESSAGGLLDAEDRRLLENTLQLRQHTVRQVMIPRTRMLAAEATDPPTGLLALLANSPYSRLPLYQDSIDHVVGVVHLKDLLCLCARADSPHDLGAVIKPAHFVPETLSVEQTFTQMQRLRQHIAIVVDEFGGTAGMVSMEDLIEEIFGSFQDEFDRDAPAIKRLGAGLLLARADLPVEELARLIGRSLPAGDVHTVGGWMLSLLGHVPEPFESVRAGDITLTVESMQRHIVETVRVAWAPEQT